MTKRSITLLQLYPFEMNIYGDWGNVLVLKKRLEWRGYAVKLLQHNPGESFPHEVDLIVGGGGQDSGQAKVKDDLQAIASPLHKLADRNTPMLMVCGLYQLFGHFFQPLNDPKIQGIGIFNAETIAGSKRFIGNVVSRSDFGEIIGYENHSGLTYLHAGQPSFGKVIKGKGNNGKDDSEGAVYKNVIGTYLHGSLLPKNPKLADYLIEKAVVNKYGHFDAKDIDDRYAEPARAHAKKRPR